MLTHCTVCGLAVATPYTLRYEMLEARKHPSSGYCRFILIISPDMDLGF